MIELILLLSIALVVCLFVMFFVVRKWDYMPLVLLVLLWYVPRQATPDGLLENLLLLRWISIPLILLVLIIQGIRMAVQRKEVRIGAIFIPLIIYIVFCIVSGVVNNVRFVELFGTLILYIRYPLLFVVLLNMDLEVETLKKFIALFLFLLAIQLPECLYRFFILGIHGDFISFTLGPWGHFDLGVYAIYGSALLVAHDTVKGVKWYHILFIVSLFSVSIIGEIKALAISIPIISALTIFVTLRQQKARKYFFMIVLPVLFIALIYGALKVWEKVNMYSGNTLAEYMEKISFVVQEPTILVDVEKADISSSRFLGSAYVWHYLRADPSSLIFGLGPGALLAGNFLGVPGRIFEEIPYLNQVAVVLGEVGIVGLLIFLWMLVNLIRPVWCVNRSVTDEQVRIISAAFIGMWFFYSLMGPFYDLVWRHDSPNFIFYFFAAFLHRYAYELHVSET